MNINEKARDNFSIEMRVFEHYEEVKRIISLAKEIQDQVKEIQDQGIRSRGRSVKGMCNIFKLLDIDLWFIVIKPWFQPERFNITHLWFNVYKDYLFKGVEIKTSGQWFSVPIEYALNNKEYGFWFPPIGEYTQHRVKVLELALEDLERIKEEYGKG